MCEEETACGGKQLPDRLFLILKINDLYLQKKFNAYEKDNVSIVLCSIVLLM